MKRGIVCIALFLFALCPGVARAQQVIEVTPAQGLTGITNVLPGAEVQIYVVQLLDNVADVRSAELGPVPGAKGITVTLSDLTVPSGLVAGDFTSLSLYRSADAVFDGGDTFMKSVAPGIGVSTLIDVSGVPGPDRDIPETPAASIYFIVTAVIAPGAGPGHAFKLGAAVNHIDIRESGGGPATSYSMGSAIVANDLNRVVIMSVVPPSLSAFPPRPIPVMPPALYGLLALCLLGYGMYSLRRSGRSNRRGGPPGRP